MNERKGERFEVGKERKRNLKERKKDRKKEIFGENGKNDRVRKERKKKMNY